MEAQAFGILCLPLSVFSSVNFTDPSWDLGRGRSRDYGRGSGQGRAGARARAGQGREGQPAFSFMKMARNGLRLFIKGSHTLDLDFIPFTMGYPSPHHPDRETEA